MYSTFETYFYCVYFTFGHLSYLCMKRELYDYTLFVKIETFVLFQNGLFSIKRGIVRMEIDDPFISQAFVKNFLLS